MRPSSVIAQLRKRFPDLPVRNASEEKEGTISVQAAGKAVISWLQDPEHLEQDPKFGELYRYLAGEGMREKEMERLAEAAAYRADLCILTADNPANEPVMDIIREIDSYFPADGCPRLWEPDREAAIRMLVEQAQSGDIILLAGKGHETYQLIGTQRIPFSEKEILRETLRERALAEIC